MLVGNALGVLDQVHSREQVNCSYHLPGQPRKVLKSSFLCPSGMEKTWGLVGFLGSLYDGTGTFWKKLRMRIKYYLLSFFFFFFFHQVSETSETTEVRRKKKLKGNRNIVTSSLGFWCMTFHLEMFYWTPALNSRLWLINLFLLLLFLLNEWI